jgi:predicted naringenin-chalcone synthase
VEHLRGRMVGTLAATSVEQSIQIASLASAVPERCIDQAATRDIVLAIAPELRSHEALFNNTGVKTRYSCVPLGWHASPQGWSSRATVFQKAAVDLLERVARQCADRAGIALTDIEALRCRASTQSLPIASACRLPWSGCRFSGWAAQAA